MISFRSILTRLSGIVIPGRAKLKLAGGVFILFVAMAIADSGVFAADKVPLTGPELNVLLAKGLLVASTDMQGGKNYTARMTYGTDGKLAGAVTLTGKAPIDVKGTWKIDGSRVCRTLVPLQPQEICEIWLRSGANEVTIRVGNSDVAISRWQ
jgi:hypothetical protein